MQAVSGFAWTTTTTIQYYTVLYCTGYMAVCSCYSLKVYSTWYNVMLEHSEHSTMVLVMNGSQFTFTLILS